MDEEREVIGVFQTEDSLQKAVIDLEIAGFDRSSLSIFGCSIVRSKKRVVGPRKLLASKNKIPRGINIAPEEIGIVEGLIVGISIVISLIISLITTKALFTPRITRVAIISCIIGFLIGLLLIKILDFAHNRYIKNQIKNGGLVLWVVTPSNERENLARSILRQCGCSYIRVKRP